MIADMQKAQEASTLRFEGLKKRNMGLIIDSGKPNILAGSSISKLSLTLPAHLTTKRRDRWFAAS